MLPRDRKIIAFKFMVPLIILMTLYTGAFWNSSSELGLPVQKIKSVFVEKKGTEDESSNYYRKAELVNLKQTIRHHPLGIGFGNKYEIIMPLDKVDFPLWEYIPHNCIYWMWVKTGFFGFIIFWVFFGTAIIQAVIDYRSMKDPYFKSIALMVLTLISSQVIIAYYDLQITFFRNMIYLGIAMAIATAIRRIEAELPDWQGGSV
jgi:O-antigen ligase